VLAAPAPSKNTLANLTVGAVMSETELKKALNWDVTKSVTKRDNLKKRDSFVCRGISGHCGSGSYGALLIMEQNLKNIDICSVGPGPGFCVLTQYVSGLGIWFCNDVSVSHAIVHVSTTL